jgi:hypothetical protein
VVLCGPRFDKFKQEVEERKRISGGFHPHVANRILSQFLAEIGKEKNWDTTTIPSAQRRYGLYTSTCHFRYRNTSKYTRNKDRIFILKIY